MSFQRLLQGVKQGDSVTPGSVNRPIDQIEANVEYLWDCLQAAGIGSTIYARQVTVEAEAVVGMAVYLNASTQRFERALAAMETDTITGQLLTAPSSDVWGIVATKQSSTLADVLLFGYAELDISNAVTGAVTAGLYYLSSQTEGGLSKQRPSVSIPVLRATTDGKVYVNPLFVDFLDSHRHYRFELTPAPAGDTSPPISGARHTITSANADWPGWLPASHTIFQSNGPSGAVFGYNLSQHRVLKDLWPPVPVSQAYLEMDRGESGSDGYKGVPIGTGGQCLLDRNGIWWMSDCYGDVPWPTELTTVSSFSGPVYTENVPPECDRERHFSLALWLTKLNFMNDTVAVTSLVSIDNRLKVYCAGTTTKGMVGDLEIDLDMSLVLGSSTTTGDLVMKELNGDIINRGPVTEGIWSESANVTLTSSRQNVISGPHTLHQGIVQISVASSPTRELPVQLIRLEGSTEETYPIPFIGLPNDIQTDFIAKFVIPQDASEGSLYFRYQARILGSVSGILPTLTVSVAKAGRPAGLSGPVDIDATYDPLALTTTATLTDSNQMVEALSDTVSVVPGDIVYVRVLRDPNSDSDSYAGTVGFVEQVGLLTNTP